MNFISRLTLADFINSFFRTTAVLHFLNDTGVQLSHFMLSYYPVKGSCIIATTLDA
nr:MAG TPA: hypothetical protein [Caudoviricetes sp.]